MECMNECGKQTAGNSKYCSDRCKVAYNRNKRNTKPEQSVTKPAVTATVTKTIKDKIADKTIFNNGEQSPPAEQDSELSRQRCATGYEQPSPMEDVESYATADTAAVEEVKSVSVKNLTREQLTNKIRHYPGIEWVKSPEFKELMRRLNTMTIKQLQAQGYSVPAWKHQAA